MAAVPGTASAQRGSELFRSPLLLGALLALGAVVRLAEFARNRSLWLDELGIARNVATRSAWSLVSSPLDYGQAAPAGFLFIEDVLWSTIHRDWALRLWPLACGLAALPLFLVLARRLLPDFGAALALALFAVSAALVDYSAQAKPYATDVLAAIVLTLLAIDLLAGRASPRRVALAGASTVWFSHSAVLVAAGLGIAMAVAALSRWPSRRRGVAIVILVWALAAGAAIGLALHDMSPGTRAYMYASWLPQFTPSTWEPIRLGAWLARRLSGAFGFNTLGFVGAPAWLLAALLGGAMLWRRDVQASLFVIMPIGATVLAAVAHLYPFGDRLILFLAPCFLILAAAGAERIRAVLARHVHAMAVAITIVAVAGTSAVLGTPAISAIARDEEVKPVLAGFALQRRPGDVVWVSYGGASAIEWYGPRYGLARGDYSLGRCSRAQPRAYLRELDEFRGRSRVWMILIHTLPSEEDLIRRYAAAIGRALVQHAYPHRLAPETYVGLFDFSDPARLAAASSATFPLNEGRPLSRGVLMACEYGPFAAPALSP